MAAIRVFVFTKYESQIDELLDKYNENRHKEWINSGRIDQNELDSFVRSYNSGYPENKNLSIQEKYNHVGALEGSDIRWEFLNGDDGELVIEKWLNINPNGRWDYYHVVERKLPKYAPFAFVLPDGSWHERGHALHFLQVEDEMSEEEWEKIWNDAVEKYDKKGFLLRIHF